MSNETNSPTPSDRTIFCVGLVLGLVLAELIYWLISGHF